MSNIVTEALEEAFKNATPVEQPTVEQPIIKKSKGRPGIHPFEGRTYLLKDEINSAMSDKNAFAELMSETYALSEDRKAELGDIINPVNELSFTIHGPIIQVLEQLHRLRAVYGSKTKINISKERLVAPTNELYMQPITEVIGMKNGKEVIRRLFEEFSDKNLYGYITIAL
jgi:hypothetical protein